MQVTALFTSSAALLMTRFESLSEVGASETTINRGRLYPTNMNTANIADFSLFCCPASC